MSEAEPQRKKLSVKSKVVSKNRRLSKSTVLRVALPPSLSSTGAGGHVTILCDAAWTVADVAREIIDKVNHKRSALEDNSGKLPQIKEYGLTLVGNHELLGESVQLMTLAKPGQPCFDLELVHRNRTQTDSKEGYMWKLRKDDPEWTRRYFMVKDKTLFYKKKKHDNNWTGKVSLEGASAVRWPATNIYGRNYVFGVTPARKNRVYIMDGESNMDRKAWLDVLLQNGVIYKGEIKTAWKHETSVKEGYLAKEVGGGLGKKKFKYVYVCLESSRMVFLKTRENNQEQAIVMLSPLDQVELAVDTFTEFTIRQVGGQVVNLNACCSDDRANWLNALTSHCKLNIQRTTRARVTSASKATHVEDYLKENPHANGEDLEAEDYLAGLDNNPGFRPTRLDDFLADIGEEEEEEEGDEEEAQGGGKASSGPASKPGSAGSSASASSSAGPASATGTGTANASNPSANPSSPGKTQTGRDSNSSSGVELGPGLMLPMKKNSSASDQPYATGPGLCPLDSEDKDEGFMWFMIVASHMDKSAQTALCQVSIIGPEGPVEIEITDNKDWSFLVTYPWPLDPGSYAINAAIQGVRVKSFPIEFHVPFPHDAHVQKDSAHNSDGEDEAGGRPSAGSGSSTVISSAASDTTHSLGQLLHADSTVRSEEPEVDPGLVESHLQDVLSSLCGGDIRQFKRLVDNFILKKWPLYDPSSPLPSTSPAAPPPRGRGHVSSQQAGEW